MIPTMISCVAGQGGGECFITHGQVNPLNLTRRTGVEELPLEALTLTARPLAATLAPPEPAWDLEQPHTRRRKRDVEMVVRAESYVDKDGNKHELVNMVSWKYYFICLLEELFVSRSVRG